MPFLPNCSTCESYFKVWEHKIASSMKEYPLGFIMRFYRLVGGPNSLPAPQDPPVLQPPGPRAPFPNATLRVRSL